MKRNCKTIIIALSMLFTIALCFGNSIAQLPQRWDTNGVRTFVFSPVLHRFAAYDEDGYLVTSGMANGGAPHCQNNPKRSCETPVGVFNIYRIGTRYCVSTEYMGPNGKRAHMPYCMYFQRQGDAIHGSPGISNINGSHGCIRVKNKAAEWLWRYFIKIGARVIVLPYLRQQTD